MKNYGTITYNEQRKTWAIECEPHVAIRLKRVFAKIEKGQHGVIVISDTIENCHDLEWFMIRYPMTVAAGAERLTERAQKHRDDISFIAKLLEGKAAPPEIELAIAVRNYQWIAARLNLTTGGILLADDVGTGKTVSGICTFTDVRTLPALVVTLTHLPTQWEKEIQRFAPDLTTHIIKTGQVYDLTIDGDGLFPPKMPDVILINYHKLSKWAETLAPLVNSIIWDECQELRREDSEKYKAATFLANNTSFRMGLSATPIYNYGGEIFNVVNCIRPGVLGTKHEFINEWCSHSYEQGKERIKDPKSFGTYMRENGIMLRRTRKDCGRELPKDQTIVHWIDADEEALHRVTGSATELARVILSQKETFRGEKMQASEQLSNLLRQATGIAKAPYVAEFVKLLVESGESVLLYGWHREVYSIWLEKMRELNPVMFTGTESVRAKNEAKEKFISGESKVLIMSLRAGAGIDGLQQKCRTVAFGEFDWSPGVHEQCVGRILRDGQKDSVASYYLAAEFGADPVMVDTLGLKKHQVDGIRHVDTELISKLQNDGGHIKKLAELYLEKIAA